ncbi:MAG TPA: DivIVA domain-containing protein [Propionibacteriaceae bacterium]
MEWFIAVVAVAALGVAAMAAAGSMGQMSKDPVHDTYRQSLPDHPLSAEDLHQVRFGIAFRGYSMAQVDDLLARLAGEVEARDARIAELLGLSDPAPAEARPAEEEPTVVPPAEVESERVEEAR